MKLWFQPSCCWAPHKWLGLPGPWLNPWVSLGTLVPGKVLVFLQLLTGSALCVAKELIFYMLASFLWMFPVAVSWTILLWMTVVSFLYEVERDGVQTINRVFLADFWRIDSGDHTLTALTHCPHGLLCSEGLQAQVNRVTVESEPQVVLIFDAQTSLLCCGFILV